MRATFRLLLPLLLCLAAAPAMAQNFSCSTGRPACLGYGDKVVDQNAQCFSGATCGYGGFVCKTKLDSVVNEYDRVVSSYNDLVRKNRTLYETAQEIVRKNADLTSEYNELLGRNRILAADLDAKAEELRTMTANYNLLLSAMSRPSVPRARDAGEKKAK